jgi:triacylglycerol esterase/lipase EstA (alpha/beta hydrolase family)
MAGGDGNPVLLVHGILDTHYMPWWGILEDHLVSAGVPREKIHRMDYHAVPGQKVRSIEGYAEQIRTTVDWLYDFHGRPVDLVAHSMGGLDCRWYVEKLGGHTVVDRLVSLSTPHRGSFPTLLSWVVPAGREMWPWSDFLHSLNDDGYPKDVEYRAVWSTCDPVIHPTSAAKLPHRGEMQGNENVCAGGYGHIGMVWRRQVFNKYRQFLLDGPAPGMEIPSDDEVATPEERPFEVPVAVEEASEDRGIAASVASVLPWR